MRICFIGERIAHHAAHSGYDRLCGHIPASPLPFGRLDAIANALPENWVRPFLDPPPNPWCWSRGQVARELRAMASLACSRTIFHWLYGENDFRWAGYAPRPFGGKVVASLHQPPDYYEKNKSRHHGLARADMLIACASNQLECLQSLTGPDRVKLVPHGVDTDFFQPGPAKAGNEIFRVVFAGSWLRDFPTLTRVIERTGRRSLGMAFDILTAERDAGRFRGLPNTTVHRNIPDQSLLALYQSAHALLLPLEDCTASNTLLEAMACGLPVVANPAGGLTDYVDPSCALLCRQGSANAMAEALLSLKQDHALRENMGRAARKKALGFDWRRIAGVMMHVYKAL